MLRSTGVRLSAPAVVAGDRRRRPSNADVEVPAERATSDRADPATADGCPRGSGYPDSAGRLLLDGHRGRVPVATSQPKVARRALTTLAMPRPMPAAAAHTRASGHENRALVGVEHRVGGLVLADSPERRPDQLRGDEAAHHAGDHGLQLPQPLPADHLGHPSHGHVESALGHGRRCYGLSSLSVSRSKVCASSERTSYCTWEPPAIFSSMRLVILSVEAWSASTKTTAP